MSASEYEDSRGETEVLQARIAELEALLARRQLTGSSASNEALLGLATAALTEEGGDEHGTACDETVHRRSFLADRLVSDDVMQPEVVVGTGMSAHLPAAVVATSSAGALEAVVAENCLSTGQAEVAGEVEGLSAVHRRGRSKVRFNSVHHSEYSESGSDSEVLFHRSRNKQRSYRSRRSHRSPNDRPEVYSRGREDRFATPLENRNVYNSRPSGRDVRAPYPPQPSAEGLEGCGEGRTSMERGRTGFEYPGADRPGWDIRVQHPPQPSATGFEGCGAGLTGMCRYETHPSHQAIRLRAVGQVGPARIAVGRPQSTKVMIALAGTRG